MIHVKWLLRNLILALLLISVAYLAGIFLAGSPRKLAARLRGETIVIEKAVADLGTLRPGETRPVRFVVSNASGRPIQILSTKTSCSCTTATTSFPVIIGASSDVSLDFSIHAPETVGAISETVEISSDVLPKMIYGKIVGAVVPSAGVSHE